jgi:hypothetical protein
MPGPGSPLIAHMRKIILIASTIAALAAAAGQTPRADNLTKPNDKKVAAGEEHAKRLLVLMDKDQNGKVSKEEFMNFMAAEFERLDVNKDGQLDVQELTQSRYTFHTAPHR